MPHPLHCGHLRNAALPKCLLAFRGSGTEMSVKPTPILQAEKCEVRERKELPRLGENAFVCMCVFKLVAWLI